MNETTSVSDKNSWVEISDATMLREDPIVSVLMLTYNHENYLAEAIEGVINQNTNFPFELIVGEDCSKDATLEVALKYQKKYPNIIRVLKGHTNVGVASNFSRIVGSARGVYSAFCEGDDYWIDSQKLQDQLQLIRGNTDISIVHGDHIVRKDFWGRRFYVQPRGRYADLLDKSRLVGDISEKCFGELVTHTSTIFCRTKDLKNYIKSFFSGISGFAYDSSIVNALALLGRAEYIDRPVSAYRIAPGSLMRSGSKGALKLALEIRRFFCVFHKHHGLYLDVSENIIKKYTFNILKASFRVNSSSDFYAAVSDLKAMKLGRIEKLELAVYGFSFSYSFSRELLTGSAMGLQMIRRIKDRFLIYTGLIERIVLKD